MDLLSKTSVGLEWWPTLFAQDNPIWMLVQTLLERNNLFGLMVELTLQDAYG
jgi:hypothetical protein